MRYAACIAVAAAWILGSCADGTPAVVPVCGDGLLEGPEVCDVGNPVSGDGCDKNCRAEAGYDCDGEPSVCVTVCGDGVIAGEESCDGSELGGASCESLEAGTGDLTCDDWDEDYDLFILGGSCHGALCIDHGASSSCDNVTFNVTPGMTYYIVVEEYSAWMGVDLDVSCN